MIRHSSKDCNVSIETSNEFHLTGDLLASGEDSLRFVPDFSLEDPSINIRKPLQRQADLEQLNNTYESGVNKSSCGKIS